MLCFKRSKHILPKINSVYNIAIKNQLIQLSIDIIICQEFTFSLSFLNLKISVIIIDPHMKCSLFIFYISKEGNLSHTFDLGPSLDSMKH